MLVSGRSIFKCGHSPDFIQLNRVPEFLRAFGIMPIYYYGKSQKLVGTSRRLVPGGHAAGTNDREAPALRLRPRRGRGRAGGSSLPNASAKSLEGLSKSTCRARGFEHNDFQIGRDGQGSPPASFAAGVAVSDGLAFMQNSQQSTCKSMYSERSSAW